MPTNLKSPCAEQDLQPVELLPGLPALRCPETQGVLLDLQDYRRWIEGQDAALGSPLRVAGLQDGQDVRRCPACTRLMQRLRSGTEQGFRIDRCAPCQFVWLDHGEWEALLAEGQTSHLLALLSDAGQRLLQRDEQRERRELDLRERLGADTLRELQRVRSWLEGRSDREELLHLLRHGW